MMYWASQYFSWRRRLDPTKYFIRNKQHYLSHARGLSDMRLCSLKHLMHLLKILWPRTNKNNFHHSLILFILKYFVTKQCGNINPVFDVKVINFFAILDTLSRRSFEFASANLFGPALRTIQRTNAHTCDVPFIECSCTGIEAFVKVNLKWYIEKIRTHLDFDVIPFSISIDVKKLSNNTLLSSAHNWIVWYTSPNHTISINNNSIE